ncbi:hypothetical protein EMIHUDRAFT_119321, partial [Emiliania huxleyi CCMP1516]|uniref:Protein kinase domain-containing protein n=2 Tax=Emiliania huxleyi TaxID=2903 RepID=A0A0D3IWC6_EMIH1
MEHEEEPDFSALGPAFEVDPDPLGLGAFGSVHLATMSLGGALGRKVMCVKAISKQRTREQAEAGGATTPWQELLQREVDITAELGRTQHRHMPRFYGTADDGTYVLLALQLCGGGELPQWLLAREEPYSERLAARLAYECLQAVRCCHDLGIVHRDIKPQNLLFGSPSDDARLKLVDFGLATRHTAGDDPLSELCGTAPEMLRGAYDERVDVWA